MTLSTWIRSWKRSLERRWALYQTLRRKAVARRQAFRPQLEMLEERSLLSAYSVTSSADDGSAGTLRYAINQANAPGSTITEIDFNIGTSGSAQTISLTSQLPALTANGVFLKGLSQGGSSNTTKLITLDGTNAGSGSDGFLLQGSNDTVSGLIIQNFAGNGIEVAGSLPPPVQGAPTTSTSDGSIAAGTYYYVVTALTAAGETTISDQESITTTGSTSSVTVNWVAVPDATGYNIYRSTSSGVYTTPALIATIGSGSTVTYTDTAAAPSAGAPPSVNTTAGGSNTIGGSVAGAGNIISGNGSDGVRIDSGASGNQVLGNYIGINAGGTAQANSGNGVEIAGTGTTIGGTASGDRNILSGNNQDGVFIDSSGSGNLLLGNFIGVGVSGSNGVGNLANGIEILGFSNSLGGTASGARNILSGNSQDGVLIDSGASSNQVLGNFIGTNASGTAGVANINGIEVKGTGNTLGGTVAGSYNIISGNSIDGVRLDSSASGNAVFGNNIGLNVNGNASLANNNGIEVAGNNNTLGTSYGVSSNVLSGNSNDGLLLDSTATGNQVLGNYIGTNTGGTAALANKVGIEDGGSSNTLGGGVLGDRNVISGNSGDGLLLDSTATAETIQNNAIGLNANETAAVANGGDGVEVKGNNNLNGGNSLSNYFTRNFISGNGHDGVLIDPGATCNQVQGNFIGVGVSGTVGVANAANGIEIQGSGNTIGGTTSGVGNVVSGSGTDGILLDSTSADNLVQGNDVGTDYTGKVAVANSGNGIEVAGTGNTLGGIAAGARNILSGNSKDGVLLDSSASGTLVKGNFIGINYSSAALGNGSNGVEIAGSKNTIGGVTGAGNTIADNPSGVLVRAGNGNTIRQNSIYANGSSNNGPGITLDSGANNNLAAPTLTWAPLSGNSLTVTGSFTAPTAYVPYELAFFANPPGDGESKIYLGSLTVTPASTGTQNFTFITTTSVTGTDPLLTATLTDPSGDTSEFSNALSFSAVQTEPGPPVITGVTPAVGPATGGATVTLTGSGFTGTTAVSFGNGHPAGFLVVSDTTLKVTSPADTAGVVDILVTNASGQSMPTTADQYTYTTQPSITTVSPNQGSTDGGSTVTLTGFNLNSATSVLFGAKPATSFTDSNGQITAVAPAHAAGVADVQVVTANGTTPITATDEYTYEVPTPVITGVSPASGSTDGGQQVTITGTDLTGATKVSFGSTPAVSFNVISATQIVATAPPGLAGTVDITVTTAGGTSAVSTADQFAYTVPAPAITGVNAGSGSTDGGAPVTITGTDLSGATQVLFGMTAATLFTVVSPSEIIATAPAGTAGTVDITVTTAGGTSATATADQYTYTAPIPVITGLSPSYGSTAGGEQVLINGTDLGGATAVKFGAVAATSFQQVSSTQIAAIAPAGSAGNVDVRVTTAGGQSAIKLADQFQYVAPTSASSPGTPLTDLPTVSGVTSSGSGGTTLVITGANFTGATQVLFSWTNPTTETSTTQSATSFTVNSATQITAVAPTIPAGKAGTRVSVTVQTPAGKSAPTTAASYAVAPNGSGTIVTPPSLPSGSSVSNPTLNGPFAPHFPSSPFVPLGGSGDGSGGTPTTATSASWANTPSNHTTYFHNGNGSGGGGGGASGQYTRNDNWSSTFHMTVKLGGQVIYSYTDKSGGDYSSSSVFGNGNPTWTTSETSWSNVSWYETPIVTTASSGTKGGNYNTNTTTYNASGSDHSNSKYTVHGSNGADGPTETGTSHYTGSGTSKRSNASHGNGSYTITGGNGTSQWQSGTTAHNGYVNKQQGTLGSGGIWVSSGSMSNSGSGTSYSSLSSKYGYTLTNSSSTRSGSTSGSGSYSGKESGGWSYHDKESYGPGGVTYKSSGQTSHSAGSSHSTSQTKGSSHSTTADGKSNSNWSHNYNDTYNSRHEGALAERLQVSCCNSGLCPCQSPVCANVR